MIRHHFVAILTGRRSNVENPRVQELAGSHDQTPSREIEGMRTSIEDLESR